MAEVCKMTGLTYQTLKFYCNEGLVPYVQGDKNNHHLFNDAMVRGGHERHSSLHQSL
ncbi:MerR family transcriptional regulator [uncultured Veillonella sp.]|uniref:MerR family transcriptional regulator n=1 Tax=uncultured Veillonella sp. TaxID=159268 RepID=UPI00338DF02C